jgi:hypothetical protein
MDSGAKRFAYSRVEGFHNELCEEGIWNRPDIQGIAWLVRAISDMSTFIARIQNINGAEIARRSGR